MPNSEPVLVVDDDLVFSTVATSVLQALGVETVLTAHDGEEGIEAVRKAERPIGLIILDLNMPKLDGLAFMRAISLTGFTGQIIVSSGESGKIVQTAQNMGRMLGIDILGALKKPIDMAEMSEMLERRSKLAADKESAGKQNEVTHVTDDMLVPFYQPQYRTKDRGLSGAESLTRIDLGNGRFMAPMGFFEDISHSRRASVVALSVIKTVFTDVCRWRAQGLTPDIAINLDASVLEDGEVVTALLTLTEDFDISPDSLVLELTETALPKDMSRLLETLARLGMAGFGLSLDDYGTGGSNFEMLRLCPFTELKIDMSIIQAMEHDPLSRQFVETTVQFARSLDLRLVAEGIETESQFEAVRAMGIDTVQGYLFSKALPPEEFARLLGESLTTRAAS